MQNTEFELRYGAVLIDPQGDAKKTATAANLTDELALYHLRTHPNCIKSFVRFPENWEQLALDSMQAEIKAVQQPAPEPAVSELPHTSVKDWFRGLLTAIINHFKK